MFDVVLLEPEIPPNTGNIIRLCANAGCGLHLIEPLGFTLDEPRLRRAGLDYHEWVRVQVHANWPTYLEQCQPQRVLGFSARGPNGLAEVNFAFGDALLFGPETRGLPIEVLATLRPEHRIRIPMRPGSRSLNLSNAVAVACYEAWRQLDYAGSANAPQG